MIMIYIYKPNLKATHSFLSNRVHHHHHHHHHHQQQQQHNHHRRRRRRRHHRRRRIRRRHHHHHHHLNFTKTVLGYYWNLREVSPDWRKKCGSFSAKNQFSCES